jgi:mannose-6-phosphate isomerase-like protein (cupin superfamily)
MRKLIKLEVAVVFTLMSCFSSAILGQDPQPSCKDCPATFVGAEEISAYLEWMSNPGVFIDQRVRTMNVGKANVSVGLVSRGSISRPGAVAEHSLVTEIYYVLSGSGTTVTGTEFIDVSPRAADEQTVRFLNGPGHRAPGLHDGIAHELEAGDVLVIPAGTGHQFTRIDDHISYLVFRVDPDKVVPLFDAEDAAELLEQ